MTSHLRSSSHPHDAALLQDASSRAEEIIRRLHQEYPEAHCALGHSSALELLVATILSAQCTDARVNQITPGLFRKYPTIEDFAAADQEELERDIFTAGFYRNKAKAIIGMARAVLERHGGEIPNTMEELVALPGVGRKTASVVLGSWFGVPALPVDTHVTRLARRLGLTEIDDPNRIERDLQALLPEEEWVFASHALIWHGRRVCFARKPECDRCCLRDLCPSAA